MPRSVLIKADEREQGQDARNPAPPPESPMLALARKVLGRWDLSLECSGQQSWIESTGARKQVWLILKIDDKVKFEALD